MTLSAGVHVCEWKDEENKLRDSSAIQWHVGGKLETANSTV